LAKRTAVIDIGSNSISLVVYEKSSRYAFHLIEKVRSRVRIGEGAYNNGGVLSEDAMQKAYDTLDEFLSISKSLGCRKVLAVATSALRDAPNKKAF
jgi:exopolyphosphatase/guanosine-5'-triphosphate,3'-diphosphate pyrophosphatase